jgi:hypothetical protein
VLPAAIEIDVQFKISPGGGIDDDMAAMLLSFQLIDMGQGITLGITGILDHRTGGLQGGRQLLNIESGKALHIELFL